MSKEFEYFETTADVGIRVSGCSLEEAFEKSALATMNIVTDIFEIKKQESKKISIISEDIYALLYDWITELMILMNSDYFIANEYDIKINKDKDNYTLTGTITGDVYDTNIYNYKTEVKAITYHEMKIDKKNDKYFLEFIVDI